MKPHILFPLVFISLCSPTSIAAPQSLRSTLATFTSTNPQSAETEVPQSCHVTKPPAHPFIPPSPYFSQTSSDGFWFGTNKLWTLLPTNGTWSLGRYRPTDTALRQKLFWWRKDYDGRRDPQPMLRVTGKRLDSPASPLATDEHANAGWKNDRDHPFIVVGIFVPTPGCWEITGHFQDADLSFVVWVTQ